MPQLAQDFGPLHEGYQPEIYVPEAVYVRQGDKAFFLLGKPERLCESLGDGITLVESIEDLDLEERRAENGETYRDVKGGEWIVEGPYQRSDVKNANGRIYKRSIWERLIADPKSYVQQTIKANGMIGHLEHPKDGRTDGNEGALKHLSLKLRDDGVVWGKSKILDTPKGRILKVYQMEGVRWGVSSRGNGSVDTQGQVNEKDFQLETFDGVMKPSTPGAYPAAAKPRIGENQIDEAALGTRNEGHGFHGIMHTHLIAHNQKAFGEARKVWNAASEHLKQQHPKASPTHVRDFLDSAHGRHFADAVVDHAGGSTDHQRLMTAVPKAYAKHKKWIDKGMKQTMNEGLDDGSDAGDTVSLDEAELPPSFISALTPKLKAAGWTVDKRGDTLYVYGPLKQEGRPRMGFLVTAADSDETDASSATITPAKITVLKTGKVKTIANGDDVFVDYTDVDHAVRRIGKVNESQQQTKESLREVAELESLIWDERTCLTESDETALVNDLVNRFGRVASAASDLPDGKFDRLRGSVAQKLMQIMRAVESGGGRTRTATGKLDESTASRAAFNRIVEGLQTRAKDLARETVCLQGEADAQTARAEDAEQRLAGEVSLREAAEGRLADVGEQLTQVGRKLTTATEYIAERTAEDIRSPVQEAVDDVVAAHPELERFRDVLENAPTASRVAELAERLATTSQTAAGSNGRTRALLRPAMPSGVVASEPLKEARRELANIPSGAQLVARAQALRGARMPVSLRTGDHG